MGDDLSVVNAARVSYDKVAEKWDDRQERLLAFLAREGHFSPFRHASISFEVYAPMLVKNQWIKHAVAASHLEDGLAWNESSRRYVTENSEYVEVEPDEWRSAPANSKQGSGIPIHVEEGAQWSERLLQHQAEGENYYQLAMQAGIAPEQARLFIPAYGLYVRWRWTTSLAGVLGFLQQRLAKDSQWEIQRYAEAVEQIAVELFPHSTTLFLGD